MKYLFTLIGLLVLPLPIFSCANIYDKNSIKGISINPFRIMLDKVPFSSFAGAFSLFSEKYQREIRFPVYWNSNYTSNTNTVFSQNIDSDEDKVNFISLDAEYRKFINYNIGRLYLGTLIRVARLSGQNKETNKLGIGFSAGYRFFSKNNKFYAGIGISMTRFILGHNNLFDDDDSPFSNNSSGIVDIEFFKIGFTF